MAEVIPVSGPGFPAKLLRMLLLGQMWSFVLFIPALDLVTTRTNRYFLHWSATALLVRLGWVTAIGLGITGLGAGLRASSRAAYERLAPVGALLCVALLAGSHAYFGGLVLVVIPVLLLWSRRRRVAWSLAGIHGGLQRACLFLAPVLPLFWLNAATYDTFGPASVPTLEDARRVPARPGETPADDVYVFVFDGWSYRLTVPTGEVAPEFPSLRAAAGGMCVFRDAHSPGCWTLGSMPRLLFQRRDRIALRGPRAGFWDGEFRPVEGLPSLFTGAREHGYRTYMVGWGHPYHRLVEGSVDHVRSVCYYHSLGESPWSMGISFLWDAGLALQPTLARVAFGSYQVQRNRALVLQTRLLLDHATAVLEDPRPGQFAVFHLPPPHWPFCFRLDGPRDLDAEYENSSPELAQEQLQYLDRVFGDFESKLRAGGKWDRATVVLTSDHTWVDDPELKASGASAERMTHVPLLIKFPGQQEASRVDAPFSNTWLADLLEAVRRERVDPVGLDRLVRERAWHQPLANEEIDFRRPLEK